MSSVPETQFFKRSSTSVIDCLKMETKKTMISSSSRQKKFWQKVYSWMTVAVNNLFSEWNNCSKLNFLLFLSS